jgi:hypothetical protein
VFRSIPSMSTGAGWKIILWSTFELSNGTMVKHLGT